MPKIQFIDPSQARQPGFVEFQPIPVNQYQKTVKDEKGNFSDDEFKAIYHDMALIREFEIMLNLITSNEHDSEAMCPEYKVVAVNIRKSKGKFKEKV